MQDIINFTVDKMPTSAKDIENLIISILRVQVQKYKENGLPNNIEPMSTDDVNFSENKIQIIIK